jgi:[ribosomal protein S5]-alanine N-acetyltransferase
MHACPRGVGVSSGPKRLTSLVTVATWGGWSVTVPPRTRLLALDDAVALADLLSEGRDFFAPWDPVRDDRFFTADGQREVISAILERHALGLALPHVILNEKGVVAGRITLDGIVRGPFQSCGMGYWVAPADNGRGLATAAVGEIVRIAFDELGLHRVEAGTLLHNTRSQRVLERNNFARYGVAPALLNIAGRWQDHLMFQRINDTWVPMA